MVEGPVKAECMEFIIYHSICIQTLSQLSFFRRTKRRNWSLCQSKDRREEERAGGPQVPDEGA